MCIRGLEMLVFRKMLLVSSCSAIQNITQAACHRCSIGAFPKDLLKLTRNPLETERKLNVHKTFRRRPGCLLNV